MRMLVRNKQKLKYSLFTGVREPIYKLDENGDKIISYVDDEGNIYYEEIGYTSGWSIPVDFLASIAQSGGEAEATAYGLSVADFDAVMLCEKNYVPLAVGSRIWQNSEVLYSDEGNIDVDEKSADFLVVRVLESLNTVKYLLKAVAK